MKRIAIFQYDWPIQSYSRDLGLIFRQYGYEVDFFGHHLKLGSYIAEDSLTEHEIRIREFEGMDKVYSDQGNFLKKLKNKAIFRAYKRKTNREFSADRIRIDRKVLLDSLKYIEFQSYDLFIGIEKQGLIWAGLLAERLNVPYLYYSLELYIEDHPIMKSLGYLREYEKYFHQHAKATIIQDPVRKEALYQANQVQIPAIFLPVSVPGPSNRYKSTYLRDRFGLSADQKILLFFGGMAPQRYCEEIIRVAQLLDENYVVIFHGFEMQEGYLTKLKSLDLNNCIVFSLDKIPEDELGTLISSADIGFALYSNENANDRLTAFSSQKIALFMKQGLPIITNANESYEALFKEFKCGIAISDVSEMPQAIVDIGTNLAIFQQEAFKAFDKYFNLDLLKIDLMESVQQLSLEEYSLAKSKADAE
jgi:glycosyltransferase involved in cell wall biosynthesis